MVEKTFLFVKFYFVNYTLKCWPINPGSFTGNDRRRSGTLNKAIADEQARGQQCLSVIISTHLINIHIQRVIYIVVD